MSKPTLARHIHKTLTYLSPEKYAALRHPDAFKRLPFINAGKIHINSYWAVPAKGEYFGGYEVGKAMAIAFLKHLATSNDSYDAYVLLSIIQSPGERLQESIERNQCKDLPINNWPTDPSSLRGQQTGFVNTIGEWLLAAAKPLGAAFDDVSEQSLAERANLALTRTDAQMRELAERVDRGQA